MNTKPPGVIMLALRRGEETVTLQPDGPPPEKFQGFSRCCTDSHRFSRFCTVSHHGRPVFPRFPQIPGWEPNLTTDGRRCTQMGPKHRTPNAEWGGRAGESERVGGPAFVGKLPPPLRSYGGTSRRAKGCPELHGFHGFTRTLGNVWDAVECVPTTRIAETTADNGSQRIITHQVFFQGVRTTA
jgi:hypothetical protein